MTHSVISTDVNGAMVVHWYFWCMESCSIGRFQVSKWN